MACRLMAVPQKFIEVTLTLGIASLAWSALSGTLSI
jgi:hypothetical protein